MAELSKEREIPIALIVIGELLLAVGAWRVAGSNFGLLLGILAAISVVGLAIMIAAAFITATITTTSFGELGPATLKLAGMFLASNGVALVLAGTGFGWAVGSAVAFILLLWLFELEVPYAAIFTIIYTVLNLLFNLTLTFLTHPARDDIEQLMNR